MDARAGGAGAHLPLGGVGGLAAGAGRGVGAGGMEGYQWDAHPQYAMMQMKMMEEENRKLREEFDALKRMLGAGAAAHPVQLELVDGW